MSQGFVTLLLHAHLPWVRHPEADDVLEESWLFEALVETYLPLLNTFEVLTADRVPFRVTLSVSPTLSQMLTDPLLTARTASRFARLIEFAARETDRTRGDGDFHPVARMYHDRLRHLYALWDTVYRRDIVTALRKFVAQGSLELITTAATHAFLPNYSMFPRAVRAQVAVAVQHHAETFGERPAGFWLPECGYYPGVDHVLREHGVRWFVVDTHGLLNATPRPRYGVFAPVYCPSGVAAFGRDYESARQVWSAEVGYPGDGAYREFHRDVGFDLPASELKGFLMLDGDRRATGLKYHRVTGRVGLEQKAPYVRAAALAKAREHAEHFIAQRTAQIHHARSVVGREPVLVAPYDAELFGHWWFEGPEFIEQVFRVAAQQDVVEFITPSDYLERLPTQQAASPSFSSWGHNGYAEVWLEKSNDWIYPHVHRATAQMLELANRFDQPDALTQGTLDQAARELLLAQASDWPFILRTRTMVPYAVRRIRQHMVRFNRLSALLTAGARDEQYLRQIGARDCLFPGLDYRVYRG
jgi:1,4-alpha-glucan branching enzyme